MKNPFIYGSYVHEPHFTDREDETKMIVSGLMGRQSFWVHSPRRMGKSSLVRHVLRELPERYQTFYVDLYRVTDTQSLCQALVDGLLEGFARYRYDARQAIETYMPTVRSASLELTADGTKVSLEMGARDRTFDSIVDDLFRAPNRAASDERPVVVALDEFQEVLALKDQALIHLIRQRIIEDDPVSWVILGSRHHLMSEAFERADQPLYRSCAPFPLHPIATEHWVPFLVERFEAGGFAIPPDLAEGLASWCGGKPAFVQQLAANLHQVALLTGEIPNDLTDAIASTLDSQAAAYLTLWDQCALSQKRVLQSLALEGPNEPYRSDRMRQYRLTPGNLRHALKTLEERGMLDRHDRLFSIADPFFEEWIRRLYA